MQGQAHRLNHSTRPSMMLGTSGRWGWRQSVGGSYCTQWCTLACLVCLLLLPTGCGTKSVSAAPAPPTPVQVAEVVQRDVPIYHEYIATLDGYVNAQIQPQVSGYLIKQNYREGALVRKNEVLFNIDPRPFQAVLDQARAQLAQAEAQLGKTQLDVQRDTPLAREKAIAQSQLDNDIQANLAARATVQADKATIEQASLNLEFTNVRSLIDGVAGIATGQVGNLVGPQTLLTTVSQLDPIKAYFVVNEQQYLAFVQRNPTPAERERTQKKLDLELITADGSTYPKRGKFFAVDRQVDVQTGAIRLAGLFPNPDNVLRPGQYGRVRFISYIRPGALLIPQKAVTELQGTYQVAVVGADNTVSIRTVKVGERTGDLWIVEDGLKPGERVVTEGVQRAREGVAVKVMPATATAEGK
ncbi:MAG TPA: efflux RND transporter periplasmic adaptor subunit [Terriglobales bacterium]|jgi:RND family efflux transporter MFP subunit|nr:efflux RND transporter periplasmic adaptor subunit [Terriglobales bacterium]